MAFAQALDTANLVWRNLHARMVQQDGFDALLRALVHFMANKPSIDNFAYTGTGDGQMEFLDAGVGGPTETWTVELTSATEFTVIGGSSGAQATGTIDTNYTTTGDTLDSKISFRINDGATLAFVSGDVFTVDFTVNAIATADIWVLDAWGVFDLFSGAPGSGLWWHGEGDGTEAIYCGIKLKEDPGDQEWLWEGRYATGYQAGNGWASQPGTSPSKFSSFWNNDMDYWLIGNARRYCMTADVASTIHSIYQGFFLPYGTPEEYPFPICVLAEHDTGIAYTSTSSTLNNPLFPNNAGFVRDLDGTHLEADDSGGGGDTINIWPASGVMSNVLNVWKNHENFDNGDHQLFPASLVKMDASPASLPRTRVNTYGTLEGLRRVTGFDNAVLTILSISGTDHVVFKNVNDSNPEMFWTMEMA